jgi:hypothetical protein
LGTPSLRSLSTSLLSTCLRGLPTAFPCSLALSSPAFVLSDIICLSRS